MERYRDPKNPLKLVEAAPCRDHRGCPKGTPEEPKTLNKINEICYRHYLECRAVGSFPDDPLVRQNAAIIMEVERDFDIYLRSKEIRDLVDAVGIMAAWQNAT